MTNVTRSPPTGSGGPRVIHDAVLVRREALQGQRHFHVGLPALDREAETPAEHGLVLAHVGARDADVVEALQRTGRAWREVEPFGEQDAHARRRVVRDPATALAAQPRLQSEGRLGASRSRDRRLEIVDAERDVVHTRPGLALDQRVLRREDGERAASEGKDRDGPGGARQLVPRQAEVALEDGRREGGLARHQRHVRDLVGERRHRR